MVAVWGRIPDGQAREILKARQKFIVKTFNEAGHQNLRLLARAMRDAATMLDCLTPEMLDFDEAISYLVATFLALHMGYHGGRLSKQDMLDRAKYRIPSGTNSEKDAVAAEGLEALQDDHPDCGIEAHYNQILPVDLGYALIVNGYASEVVIVNDLRSTHQFTMPAEKPDWVRLWTWTDESVDKIEGVIRRLKKRIENFDITDPGEVLQLYAASKFIAKRNGIELNEIEVAGLFRKYIRSLANQGKVPARIPGTLRKGTSYGYGDEAGTCSYGGFAFEISESDRRIIDLMKAQQDIALAKKLPEYATELLNELASDFSVFASRFEGNSSTANYHETPILHYVNINDASDIFLEIFSRSRDEAKAFLKIIEKRRSERREDLKEEWGWIDKFRDTSIRKAQDRSKMFGAQIAQQFVWFLKIE